MKAKLYLYRLIVAVVLYYVGVLALIHVLDPDLDPIGWPMSAYAIREYGRLMTTTYFVAAAGFVATAMLVFRTNTERSRLVTVSAYMFILAVVGITIAGIFPMDQDFPPTTLSGKMHGVGGSLTFPALGLAPLLASIGFRNMPRQTRLPLLVLSAGVLICTPLLFVTLQLSAEVPSMRIAGLVQRCHFLLLFAWMIWAARYLAIACQTSEQRAV